MRLPDPRCREAQARAGPARSARSSGSSRWKATAAPRLSPVVAVNVPTTRSTLRDGRIVPGNRPGTVGHARCPARRSRRSTPRPAPTCPRATEGMIHVEGPAGDGRLPEPARRDRQGRSSDGWYYTGDLGHVDADGFLKITDRLSRFSKIGGEMVPHLAVESAIAGGGRGRTSSASRSPSLPDPKRGERLVRALHRPRPAPPRRSTGGSTAGTAAEALDSLGRRFRRRSRRIPMLGTGQARPAPAPRDRRASGPGRLS